MELDAALVQFDATDANIKRLESIIEEMGKVAAKAVHYIADSPSLRERYNELEEGWRLVSAALPAIGGVRIFAEPVHPDRLFEADLEEHEGYYEDIVRANELREAAGGAMEDLSRYRQAFNTMRRRLVRDRLIEVMTGMTNMLKDAAATTSNSNVDAEAEMVDEVRARFGEIERLCGGYVPESKGWQDLRRHLAWGQGCDIHEMHWNDWPLVRQDIEAWLYSSPLEPVPVNATDLADIVQSKPSGRLTIALSWSVLDDNAFERLLYNIILEASEYTNPQWLTRTSAPDRGRDLSCERAVHDPLSGTRYERLVIQAKHYQAKSVAVPDVYTPTAQMRLWDPPVAVLIVATSGRFTNDAVDWIEKHNARGELPRVEAWPDSHLEMLLARRPHLTAEFGLHYNKPEPGRPV